MSEIAPTEVEATPAKEPEAVQQKPAFTWPLGFSIVVVGAAVVVATAGLKSMAAILGPAFLAISLVVAVRPVRQWLIRQGIPKFVSAMITLVLLYGLLIALIGALTYSVFALVEILPSYASKFQTLYLDVSGWLASMGVSENQLSDQFLNYLQPSRVLSWVTTALNGVTATGSLLFVLVMVLAFLVVDSGIISGRGAYLKEHRPHLAAAIEDFQYRTNRYWVVNTIFGLIVAVINVVALLILGVPLALVWGVFSFVTNYIPNIGFVIGMIPPALIALLDGDWKTMLWVIALFSVINFTMQQIVQPKVTGDAVGLNTTITFISLLFWSMVIGPLGAILAVPLTLFFKAILIDADPSSRWISVFLTTDFNKKETLAPHSKKAERVQEEEEDQKLVEEN